MNWNTVFFVILYQANRLIVMLQIVTIMLVQIIKLSDKMHTIQTRFSLWTRFQLVCTKSTNAHERSFLFYPHAAPQCRRIYWHFYTALLLSQRRILKTFSPILSPFSIIVWTIYRLLFLFIIISTKIRANFTSKR